MRNDLQLYVGKFVRTQVNNYIGWRSLRGEEPGLADVSPHAAAARPTDVSGLPTTYISVGGLDLFLEENMIYADRFGRAEPFKLIICASTTCGGAPSSTANDAAARPRRGASGSSS